MQNTFYFKHENMENAKKVKEFYLQVLKEFSERLEREMRYKERFITSDQIQELESRVKYRLDTPAHLFDLFLNMKEGATKVEHEPKNEPEASLKTTEVKEEYDEANNDYRIPSQNRISTIDFTSGEKDEESDGDDLEDYEDAIQKGDGPIIAFRPVKSQIEVKKEDNFEGYKGRQLQSQKSIIKEEQNESDSSVEVLTTEQCQECLNSVLLSTFNTCTLKHKPKEQKIMINLDNTFLKSMDNQFYIGQVTVDISKIQKSEVKKEYSFNPHFDRKKYKG